MLKKFIAFYFLLIPLFSIGQSDCIDGAQPAIDDLLSLDYEDALLAFHKAYLTEKDKENKACLAYYHGKLYYSYGEKEVAKQIWKVAFDDYTQLEVNDSLLAHRLIYNCGITELNERQYSAAIKDFKQAFNYVSDVVNQSKCQVKIGACYREQGEFTIANYYYQLAVQANQDNQSNKWLTEAYRKMAVNYNALGEPDSALKYADLQLISAEDLSTSVKTFSRMNSHFIAGNAHEIKGDLTTAIDYFKESLAIARSIDNDLYIFNNHSNLGYVYNQMGELNKATFYLELAKQNAIVLNDSLKVADILNTIGDISFNNQNYSNASEQYLEALNYYLQPKTLYSHSEFPSTNAVTALSELDHIFIYSKYVALSMMAEAKKSKNKSTMSSALSYLHFADSLLFMVNENAIDNQSKFYWRKEANELYTNAIQAAKFTNNYDELFYFIERGKYFVLRTLMEENIKLGKLDDTFQKDLKTLKQDIAGLEIKADQFGFEQNELHELISLKEQYGQIIDSLKNLSNEKLPTLKEMSLHDLKNDFLEDNQQLYISYFETEQITYGLFVSRDSTWLRTIDNDTSYMNCKQNFIHNIQHPINTTKQLDEYLYNGYKLYSYILDSSISSYKDLIINPSGTLSLLAFDALTSQPDTASILVKQHTIRYCLSPSIELVNLNHETKTTTTLFVAPVDFTNLKMNSLPNSKNEIDLIEKRIGGKTLAFEEATKINFNQTLHNYNAIHLATHAMANDSTDELPWIGFYDEKMFLPEIYNLPLQNKFVVLSACETFKGDVISGEGIMNLVWGIHYAGANSVVATLWNTYDEVSKELMSDFYIALKAGATKEDALRTAKIQQIEKNGIQPNQWAPFIYIGDSSTMTFKANNKRMIKIMVGLFISLLLIVAYRIK